MTDIFEAGIMTTLDHILDNKDWRSEQQQALMAKYPEQSVLAIKLNIPGLMKQSPALQEIFQAGMERLERIFSQKILEKALYLDRETGPEAFLVVDETWHVAKVLTIRFEQMDLLGRLFDVDVMAKLNQDQQVSRTELGFDSRKCFICGEDAKACARSQKHTAKELTDALNQMYVAYLQSKSVV